MSQQRMSHRAPQRSVSRSVQERLYMEKVAHEIRVNRNNNARKMVVYLREKQAGDMTLNQKAKRELNTIEQAIKQGSDIHTAVRLAAPGLNDRQCYNLARGLCKQAKDGWQEKLISYLGDPKVRAALGAAGGGALGYGASSLMNGDDDKKNRRRNIMAALAGAGAGGAGGYFSDEIAGAGKGLYDQLFGGGEISGPQLPEGVDAESDRGPRDSRVLDNLINKHRFNSNPDNFRDYEQESVNEEVGRQHDGRGQNLWETLKDEAENGPLPDRPDISFPYIEGAQGAGRRNERPGDNGLSDLQSLFGDDGSPNIMENNMTLDPQKAPFEPIPQQKLSPASPDLSQFDPRTREQLSDSSGNPMFNFSR